MELETTGCRSVGADPTAQVAMRRADGKPIKCNRRCPYWADGFHEGIEVRKSLHEIT